MTTDLDAATVRILGRGMGFGRLMQLVEQEWRSADGDGSEHTVGPCAALLVPCPCAADSVCDWCCGTRRVTERVLWAIQIHADHADHADQSASPLPGERRRPVAPPRAGDTLLLIVRGDGIGQASAGWSPVGVVQGFTLSSMTVTQADLDVEALGLPSDVAVHELRVDGDALELGRRAAAVVTDVLGRAPDAFGPATPAPAAPPFDPVADARLREIASGEYGPNRQEGKAMARELLGVRSIRAHIDKLARLRTEAQVPVFDSREGRERGDISDVVASCDPASLVTIKDISFIDEPPGISFGFLVHDEAVKELRARADAAAPAPPPDDLAARRPTSCACGETKCGPERPATVVPFDRKPGGSR